MSDHTSGPWNYYSSSSAVGSLVPPHRSISVVSGPWKMRTLAREAERAANGRLIAAAPDLLFALRELNRAWNATSFPCSDRMDAALKAADDAIAKAEGR